MICQKTLRKLLETLSKDFHGLVSPRISFKYIEI